MKKRGEMGRGQERQIKWKSSQKNKSTEVQWREVERERGRQMRKEERSNRRRCDLTYSAAMTL